MIKWFVVSVKSTVALDATAVLRDSRNGCDELLFRLPERDHEVPFVYVPEYCTP